MRVILVHGSVAGGRATWGAQSRGLADRFELVVVERPGFPPGPPVERVDFEAEAPAIAALLRDGDHLVGHSYGGVICLLAAAAAPAKVASLTVIEPPATRVALGREAADAFAAAGAAWWADGPRNDPEAFLRGFLATVGADLDPPSPLPDDLAQGARLLVTERGPWEAEIPVDELAAAPFPKLVVSGAHHPGFDAICDALVERLHAERLVLPGYGHSPHRHPAFNDAFAAFVEKAGAAGGR